VLVKRPASAGRFFWEILRAMSHADVEIVSECTRRFAAGGHVTDDYFDPQIVWDTSESEMPAAGVYHGHEGVRQFFRDWLADWSEYQIEARECFDAGGAVVLVFRQAGTGKRSGVRAERDFFGVWELRDSKVVRFRLFASREQALKAAQLQD
jgi:uncharacterized protein